MRYVKPGSAGIRKDAWTHRQDCLLAEVVLQEAAGTERIPTEAFAIASPVVGRSASACQQRWYGELRTKHWEFVEPTKPVITIVPKEPEPVKSDPVNRPAHYTQGGIETIDFIRAKMSHAEFSGYCRGNVLKYISRAPDKNGVEDLRKAATYLKWLIDHQEGAGDNADSNQAETGSPQTAGSGRVGTDESGTHPEGNRLQD